jgi:cytochrome P450
LPKDVEGYRPLKALIGAESIIAKEGSDWKATRKRSNPNFQPKHIHSLTEQIATRVKVFTSRLQQLADSGDPLKLSDCARTTSCSSIDSTTAVASITLHACPSVGPLPDHYRRLFG